MPTFHSEIIAKLKQQALSENELNKLKRELSLKYKLSSVPTNIEILLHTTKKDFPLLKKKLLTKPTRSISGVAPVAIMTKPFPCPHGKCAYCMGGPDSYFGNVPQSYTGKEPATMRGIRNNYEPYLQIFNRLEQYIILGHNCEKVELIVMGGTFPSTPLEYQENFIKDSFQALNDFSALFYTKKGEFNYLKFKEFFELPTEDLMDEPRRLRIQKKLLKLKKKNSKISVLEQEQCKNETSKIRCVALVIETRPDYAFLEQGNQLLRLGCTRVEIGIESVYDDVLKKINRGHGTKETILAIKTLKDLGFKVAAHYMPGLPGVNLKKDLAGLKLLFSNPDYKPDMLKLYPCMVARGTQLYEEYQAGKFQPLDAEKAAKLIAEFKPFVPEYCRIIRIQRDIPSSQIVAGVKMTNLRQYLEEKYQPKCRCIRCREPKNKEINWNKVGIKVLEYEASYGKEFFISVEDKDNDLLLGFIRMRFPSQYLRLEITSQSALIRELHIYGTATGIGESGSSASGSVQHKGWGKKLLEMAEELAHKNKKNKIVVISGVGVREYYRKQGYELEGVYMVKKV